MTDEEIKERAQRYIKENYCDKDALCKDGCLLEAKNDDNATVFCLVKETERGFVYGFKAALEELRIDIDKLTLGDVKFAMEHSPYYAEMVLRAMADDVIKMCRNVVIKNN